MLRGVCASLFLVFVLVLGSVASATSSVNAKWLDIQHDQVRFDFGDQGGEIHYSCKHTLTTSASDDWDVRCFQDGNTSIERTFTVHLRIQPHARLNAPEGMPKMAYEILYWVTDHEAKPATGSKFMGSTIWLRAKDASSLHSMDLGQDINDTDVLNVSVVF